MLPAGAIVLAGREGCEMDAFTIDAMDLVAFEQMLADEWAVARSDIYRPGYGPTPLINAVQPIRPQKALERLQVSAGQLVQLLRSGTLGRPGKLGHGKVAWRKDEIEGIMPLGNLMS